MTTENKEESSYENKLTDSELRIKGLLMSAVVEATVFVDSMPCNDAGAVMSPKLVMTVDGCTGDVGVVRHADGAWYAHVKLGLIEFAAHAQSRDGILAQCAQRLSSAWVTLHAQLLKAASEIQDSSEYDYYPMDDGELRIAKTTDCPYPYAAHAEFKAYGCSMSYYGETPGKAVAHLIHGFEHAGGFGGA